MNLLCQKLLLLSVIVSAGVLLECHAPALKPPREAGGRGGESTAAGGGADFIFSASQRVVMAFNCVPGRRCVCGLFCVEVSV